MKGLVEDCPGRWPLVFLIDWGALRTEYMTSQAWKLPGSVTGKGPGPEQVCLGPAGSMWVPDFVQKWFYNVSPSDFESMFYKAGDS